MNFKISLNASPEKIITRQIRTAITAEMIFYFDYVTASVVNVVPAATPSFRLLYSMYLKNKL